MNKKIKVLLDCLPVAPFRTQLTEEIEKEVERLKAVPMKYRRMAFNAELQLENEALRKEAEHWKANHEHQVMAARALKEREDLPVERLRYYEDFLALRAENETLRGRVSYLCGEKDGYRYLSNKSNEENESLKVKLEVAQNDLKSALEMLAGWCVAVDVNGAGWDDWDDHYKDAMYRDGSLRSQLDAAIAEVRLAYY